MDFSLIFNQLLVLFSLIFLGYILNKLNILDLHTNKKLSSFVVNVSAPALIIASMSDPTIDRQEINLLLIIFIASICYIFLYILTLFIPKLIKVQTEDYGIYKFMIMFSNVGFMGFPVIASIYGREAIIYASLFNLPFYLLIYTLGIYFVSLHSEKQMNFNWKLFFNAGVVAVIIGVGLLLTQLRLPRFLEDTVNMIGDLTTPLAMLIIGVSLANIPMKSVFMNTRLYIFSFLKLVVFPIIIWLALRAVLDNQLLIGVSVVIVGMPVAANAVMLSNEFGGNEKLASEGVLMTTLFSIITIPLLVFILS
ncbi:hypothetical protein EDC18_10328 [Natranaerovirga pectinivora]|uniref:AEC family transporter n=1 Tax=Natranaerovirga pectinivora TaxID=682400 RepID=A0A4R3MMS4_9FIRM|nr:AEC family transporter [Natranaerovirga pectinivora]TCT15324.1 hypothetical protein EDC18_10328 [Natranaerovirga pectinivora]